jgi:DNA-binding transcriptional LysR family regulator
MDNFAEFRHFKYLLAIAEHGGLRAAASALNTGQPSMSRQIREFQEHYGIRFFRRKKGHRIELTPAGEALKIIAKDILEMREEALEALLAIHHGKSETLRIGCTPFVDKELCKKATELQRTLVPAATLRVFYGDTRTLIEQLKHDKLDAAIISLPIVNEGLRTVTVNRDRLVACLPNDHPLAKKTALSATDLTKNLRVFRQPCQNPEAHERLIELLAELGVELEEELYTSHPHEMQESIKSGLGFALIREGTPLLDGLTVRPIIGVEWTVDTAFVYGQASTSQIIPMIAKNLRRHCSRVAVGQTMKKGPKKVDVSGSFHKKTRVG